MGDISQEGFCFFRRSVQKASCRSFFLRLFLDVRIVWAPRGFPPSAMGLGFTLILLISIPVTNTSVNPARSTGPALIAGGWAIQQLWLFWIAPMFGAVLGGLNYRYLSKSEELAAERREAA